MPNIKGAYPLNTTDTLIFQTPKSSFYLLKVKARAKSEKQRDSTDDEDITLKSISFEFIEQGSTTPKDTNTIQPYQDELYHNDYNKLDKHILSAVNYWNNFFSKQQYPPPQPLDPNLVKAMIYRESTLGNDKRNNGKIDVMQVWNPLDPAQPTLLGKTPEKEFLNPNTAEFIHNTYPAGIGAPDVLTKG